MKEGDRTPYSWFILSDSTFLPKTAGDCWSRTWQGNAGGVAVFYRQSIELPDSSPTGNALPAKQEEGTMLLLLLLLGEGSTFSLSSILSEQPSQLIWNRVTRGLEARMFLCSWRRRRGGLWFRIKAGSPKSLLQISNCGENPSQEVDSFTTINSCFASQ